MPTLSELLARAPATTISGGDPSISAVSADSRAVKPGTLFAALPGARADGTAYLAQARAAGAAALLVSAGTATPDGCPTAQAADVRAAFAWAAAALAGYPAEALSLVGVTGTNGKTTTTYLLEAMAAAAGRRPGVIGTVAYRIDGQALPASHTTPPADVFHELLAQMRRRGVDLVACEVSSHALDQRRVDGAPFAAAGFSNLTQDHLDYHGDLERYFAAKRRLFEDCRAPGAAAVINVDDPWGKRLAAELRPPVLGCSAAGAPAELRVLSHTLDLEGIDARVASPAGELRLRSPLLGRFNLDNLLLAAGLALAAGLPPAAIATGARACARVPGRLDRVALPGQRHAAVLIDYAHTPDALERALAAVRALGPRRLLCVFGCGGDRDRGKRPLMGRAAGQGADLVLVTSDNPRSEEPRAIIDQILPGLRSSGLGALAAGQRRGWAVEPDRQAAIRQAIALAEPGDAVLIAGKGHEDYQIIGAHRVHFSDHEQAAAALAERLGVPHG